MDLERHDPALTRRRFIGLTAASLVGLYLSGLTGCSSSDTDGLGESAQSSSREGGSSDVGDSLDESGEVLTSTSGPLSRKGTICVAEYASSTVAFLDAASGQVLERVNVGANPAALLQVGEAVYVSVFGTGQVARVPLSATEGVSTFPVGDQPMGMAVSPYTGYLYVADYIEDRIRVVDMTIGSLIDTFTLPERGFDDRSEALSCCVESVTRGRRPITLATSPDGQVLYSGDFATYDIARIDLAGGGELDPFDGVVGLRDLTVAPDGSTLLCAGVGGRDYPIEDLKVIDAATGEELAKVPVGQAPADVAVNARTSRFACVSRDAGLLTIGDVGTWEVTGTLALGGGADGVAYTASGEAVLVGDSTMGTLTCIDAADLSVRWETGGLSAPRSILEVE